VGTARIIALFVLGLLLVLVAIPTWLTMSAVVGYIMVLGAVAVGVILIARRKGSVVPLVLGILLIVVGSVAFSGMLYIHMTLYTAVKGVEEATKVKTLSATLGAPVTIYDWRITVTNVREAKYVEYEGRYYGAESGKKIIIITLRIENTGVETKTPSDIWDFVLVTDAGKSYERVDYYYLKYFWSPSSDVMRNAVKTERLSLFTSLAPKSYIEGDILFEITEVEKPATLYFKVGVVGGYQVEVKLQK